MNFKAMDIQDDRIVCLGISRSVAPMKSGNLRYNAMSSYLTSDGWCIEYSLGKAFYIYFLEHGTRQSVKWKDFIGVTTVTLLSEYMYSKYANNDIKQTAEFVSMGEFGNFDSLKSSGNMKMLTLREERAYNSFSTNVMKMGIENKWEQSEAHEVPSKFQERK
jgi:hypothetical protein